jgi:hypothetical protein
VIQLIVAVTISGVLLYAGQAKALDRAGFAEALAGYGLGPRARFSLALAVPPVELALAGGLLLIPAVTLFLASALFAAFAAAVGWALFTGRRGRPCGCFGSKGLPLGPAHLLFATGVGAAAFMAALIAEPANTVPIAGRLLLIGPALLTALATAGVVATIQTVRDEKGV